MGIYDTTRYYILTMNGKIIKVSSKKAYAHDQQLTNDEYELIANNYGGINRFIEGAIYNFGEIVYETNKFIFRELG